MAKRDNDELYDSLSAPLGDIISSVARGVADAQQALDLRTIETYKEIYGKGDELREELRQLGYQPTWYKIPEVNAEIVMSLSISENSETNLQQIATPDKSSKPNALKLYAAPVDANYSNRYNYDIKGASKLTFKIVPVPPAPTAEEMKVVPFLIDKTLEDAEALLKMLNIPYETEEDPLLASPTDAVENQEVVEEINLGTAEKVVAENVVTPSRVLDTNPKPGVILKPGQKLSLIIKI